MNHWGVYALQGITHLVFVEGLSSNEDGALVEGWSAVMEAAKNAALIITEIMPTPPYTTWQKVRSPHSKESTLREFWQHTKEAAMTEAVLCGLHQFLSVWDYQLSKLKYPCSCESMTERNGLVHSCLFLTVLPTTSRSQLDHKPRARGLAERCAGLDAAGSSPSRCVGG